MHTLTTDQYNQLDPDQQAATGRYIADTTNVPLVDVVTLRYSAATADEPSCLTIEARDLATGDPFGLIDLIWTDVADPPCLHRWATDNDEAAAQ